jgi:hypothetical protein
MNIRTLRLVAAAGAGAALCGLRPIGAQQIPVKAGITVSPDTVKVADPFRITVGIRAPRGATIEFPRVTDSASAIQSIDPVAVRTSADTTAAEQYADYRVAAWDVGVQAIRLADAIVRYNGAERHIPLSASVFVASVLPADTAKRVPKPPRALFELNPFPWWLIALLIAAAIALGWLIWWWFRRRRKSANPAIVDPFAQAKSEFQRIESLGLLDAGERGRYVALMIDVVRDYLAARHAQAALSLTSTELQRTVHGLPSVPEERLTRVLSEADLIKFARRPVSTDRAREIGREARTIVAEENKAARPPAEQEVAA